MQILQTVLLYVIPFVLVLGVVVTIHELGHFLAAKALGTKIDRFAIGFGRAIFSWQDKDGVEWRIGWAPIGGYVRFAGDDNAASIPDADDLDAMRRDLIERGRGGEISRYFHFKPLWQRAVIVAAGPVANFLLAISIFAGLVLALGQPVGSTKVFTVEPGSAAAEAGIRPGDVIQRVGGQRVRSFPEISDALLLSTGTPTPITLERAGETLTFVAVPKAATQVSVLGTKHATGRLGIGVDPQNADITNQRVGPIEALGLGVERTWQTIKRTVVYIARIFSGRESADQLAGPIGMAHMSGAVASKVSDVSDGAGEFLGRMSVTVVSLIAFISVGIGFLNLLPVPVLDGGHLMFYAYEAVARRPLAAKVQAAGYRVGLALVLGLMLFATWNDLQRLRVFNLFDGLFS